MFKIHSCAVFTLLILSVSTMCQAGGNDAKQFIYLDDWTYDLVDYWIDNGRLQHRFVLNQPYTRAEIDSGCRVDDNWRQLQKKYYRHAFGVQGFARLLLYGRGNAAFVSNDDLPVRKGLVQAPVDDVALYDNRSKIHGNFAAQFNFMLPHLALVNRTMINSEYKDDPLFFGDTREWIFGKINDAYMNVNAGPVDVFLGRMDRNWGTLGSPGLILSNAPYSYDQAHLTYTSGKFKFSMLVARLEDLMAVTDAAPDSFFNARKYVTAHRADFSVSDNLQFALSEVAIYGGPERDFEFGFLNPMNYFYVVQRNNKQQMSGLWAFDLFFKPHRHINTFFQFLLDDIIVNNEPGQDDRANYPDRFGLTLKLAQADLWLAGLQSHLLYSRIWNRTYQTRRTYENYHYQGKGLGYPGAGVEHVGIGINWFRSYPLLLKFAGDYRRAGDVRLSDLFPLKKEVFPIAVVEKYMAFKLEGLWFLSPAFRLSLSTRYERFWNYNHDANDNHKNFSIILGLQLNWLAGVAL